MLGWFTGAARQDDCSTLLEPPETPAPVFAVRAFKTAIFGTPHTIDVEPPNPSLTSNEDAANMKKASAPITKDLDAAARPNPSFTQSDNHTVTAKTNFLPSPTKGILLTPGTAALRRKTVSFGAALIDNEGYKSTNASRSGLPSDFPGNYPSPWTSKAGKSGRQQQTALTRSLLNVREEMVATQQGGQAATTTKVAPPQDIGQRRISKSRHGSEAEQPDQEADITLDFNEPRSCSGQHWKREYEHYEDKTRHEMKKLVRYRRMAKSYAMKKDAEATDLIEKLRKERAKVVRMEEEVSELAAQMISDPVAGDNGGPEQAQIMKALAKQTALAFEYKRKVDQFEAALAQHGHPKTNNNSQATKTFARPESEENPKGMSQALKSAREQLQEMASLQSEMVTLRTTVSDAEQKATTLHEENISLKKNLAKLKEEMDQSETRGTVREQLQKQREENLEVQKKELKERLAQCKVEHKSVQAATVRHFDKERSTLQQQIAVLEASSEVNGDNNNKEINFTLRAQLADSTSAHMKIVKDLQHQLAQLQKSTTKEGSDPGSMSMDLQHHQRKTLQELRQAREEASTLRLQEQVMRQELEDSRAEVHRLRRVPKPQDNRTTKDPAIDIWISDETGRENIRPSGRARASCSAGPLNPPGSSHGTALSDINTNRNNEQLPSRLSQAHSVSPSKDDSNFGHPLLQESVEFSLPALPSPEIFISSASKSAQARYTTTASPRPSMLSLASSPPKFEPMRLPLNTATAAPEKTVVASTRNAERDHRTATTASISSSRASSLLGGKTRSTLPPDRAAAAKARLQQRNAEKRIAHENGKENMRG